MTTDEIKPTLKQLLDYIERVDDGEIDMDDLYLEVSRDALPSKVDDYINLAKILEQRSEFCAKRSKEFGEKAKSLENQRASLLDRLGFLMDRYQFEKLQGNEYSVTTNKTVSVGLVNYQDPRDYATSYPEFIKANTKLEFDKTKIKEYLTSNRNEILPFAVLKVKTNVRSRNKT